MDALLNWLSELPSPLYWLCLAGIAALGVLLLGFLCEAAGLDILFDVSAVKSRTFFEWLKRLLRAYMLVGLIAAIGLAIMFAPYLALRYVFDWSHGYAALLGLPIGLIFMWACVYAYEVRGSRKN